METITAYKVGDRVFDTKQKAAQHEAMTKLDNEFKTYGIPMEWLFVPANWNWLKFQMEAYFAAIKSE